MTPQQAAAIGQSESLRMMFYAFLAGEVIILFYMARGDFANGILFFMRAHQNIHYVVVVAILFGSTWLFGRLNGKEILIQGQSAFFTPFKYGLFSIWIAIGYGCVVGIVKADKTGLSVSELMKTYILTPYIQTTVVLIVPLAVYAYYCGHRIKAGKAGRK